MHDYDLGKMAAGAAAPAFGLAAAAGAGLGLLERDALAALAGSVAIAVTGRHLQRVTAPLHTAISSGSSLATISARRGSRNGGRASFSPRLASSSSTAKPGSSEAISKRMPFGSRK